MSQDTTVRLHVYLPDGKTFEGTADVPAELEAELSSRGTLTALVLPPYPTRTENALTEATRPLDTGSPNP